MIEIGGYLDLSANWKSKKLPHDPILLNSGRNCFRYIARQRKITRVLMPYYTCHTVVGALKSDGVEVAFYSLDEDFMPEVTPKERDEHIIYNNYYGVMDDNVKKAAGQFKNLMVDNSQAFFSTPLRGVDTVSSPRKFFGLPDGGLLYPGTELVEGELDEERSSERIMHMARRLDYGAKDAFDLSRSARESLVDLPVRRMSQLTRVLLGSLDFDFAREQRRENWSVLDNVLGESNRFKGGLSQNEVPLFYPYFCSKAGLRPFLISKGVFVGRYWPDVEDLVTPDSFEADLVEFMIPLPIDQRYGEQDMIRVLSIIDEL